jgi:hypothetical protein
VHRREVAGRNHDVHLTRALSQTPGLVEVAVNVAERQHAHQSPNVRSSGLEYFADVAARGSHVRCSV